MRVALCLLWLALSLACAQAAPAPFKKPNAKQPPLTTERLRTLLAEKRFFDIKSIEQRGQRTWEVVGRRGIPWSEPAWTLRTFVVSEEIGGQGRHLKVAEVAVHGPLQ
jgi:hypothetical protein